MEGHSVKIVRVSITNRVSKRSLIYCERGVLVNYIGRQFLLMIWLAALLVELVDSP